MKNPDVIRFFITLSDSDKQRFRMLVEMMHEWEKADSFDAAKRRPGRFLKDGGGKQFAKGA